MSRFETKKFKLKTGIQDDVYSISGIGDGGIQFYSRELPVFFDEILLINMMIQITIKAIPNTVKHMAIIKVTLFPVESNDVVASVVLNENVFGSKT